MIGKAFYLFFAAAVLLALGWNFLAPEELKPILMRLFVIALGLALGCLAFQGISEQQIRLGPGRPLVQRSRNPINYWGIIALNSALALLLVAVGLLVRR
jgi:hypothetical protein